MKKNILLSLLAAMFLVGCGEDVVLENTVTDTENESTSEVESDDSTSSTTIDFHNQGLACLSCHGYTTPSDAPVYSRDDDEDEYPDEKFTSGATVYTSLNGNDSSTYAVGYSIRLVLEATGSVINYADGRGSANSYTSTSTDTMNNYTAQVVDANGAVVNTSLTDSHGLDRLDCNSCHSSTGSDGAPGRIVSYDYYSSISTTTTTTDTTTATTTDTTTTDTTTSTATVSFSSDVMPVLETSCQGCHGSSGNFTITDTSSTYTNITTNSFVDTANVDSSSLLTKANGISHGGGTIFSTSDTGYITLRDWITQGALNN